MSAFEIKVTPTRYKNKKLESKEPTEVVMAPFSGKSIVLFEDVPVSKTARRLLRVINPSEDDIQVSVFKSITAEHNVSLEWQEKCVPAQSEISMEIVWSPQIDVACTEKLQLMDNRNFRKDVMIILKSKPVKQVKNNQKFPTLSSGNKSHVKTLRLKSPTGAASKAASKLAHQRHQKKPLQNRVETQKKLFTVQDAARKGGNVEKSKSVNLNKNKRHFPKNNHLSPLMERNIYVNNKNKTPETINMSPCVPYSEEETLKENLTPISANNVLNMIDELTFTPATVTVSKCIQSKLSSLPTPTKTSVDYVRELKPRSLTTELHSEDYSSEDVHNDSKGTTMVLTNKTFDVKLSESLEISDENLISFSNEGSQTNACTMNINRTTVICTTPINRPLDIIQEEENSPCSSYTVPKTKKPTACETPQKFEKDLKRDIKIIGTPLRKHSESMKNLHRKSPQSILITQGSLPNLNNMESIKSFEQNRYFLQATSRTDIKKSNPTISAAEEETFKLKSEMRSELSAQLNVSHASLISHHELQFNQNEILAQSSRFNLNEVGIKSRKNSPSFNKNKIVSTVKCTNTPPKIFRKPFAASESQKRRSNELSYSDSQSMDSVISGSSTASLRTNSTKSSYAAVSPPKRQKLEKANSTLSKQRTSPSVSAAAKVKSWSQTQPKKFKLCKKLTLVKKPFTPRKLTAEPRIKLYEADLYLQSYINPDPFAATTTCDPFLASTMYLDETSVDRHQTDLMKWLNALVTMPADLDTDSNAKIDVGKLFNEVRHKDLVLAPSREEQSINYLNNLRLESLRKAAVELFLSEEMRIPCSKVAVYIQKNALRIRRDRNLHLDVVMQRDILELLLSFNPLWLRLGLEVVYGEKIYLQSNRDIVGLSSFILNRLFRDRVLEQKFSRAFTLCEEYADHIKKFTLQKFFFLLLFLDKAKEKRMIAHNPCLFMKKSAHKETREILLRFSSELLANVGDITRELKRLGYVLTHKQSYLDEFDYAFHNLAVDLRDGVRLTRVIEIILLREDLTAQLRAPAISRLQRIFNVNLALNGLNEADFQLKGDIAANDIVDGHREKTLSVLWQIIYKFRSPKFHAAARTIQKWWRLLWLRVVIHRKIRHREEQRRKLAATKIQALYRGYVSRRMVSNYKQKCTQAAIVFQKYIRSYIARRRYLKIVHSTIVIQKWLKTCLISKQDRRNFLLYRKSAIYLQQHWRRRQQARVLKEQARLEKCLYIQCRNKAASCIQANWRGYKVRTEFMKIVSAVLKLQSLFRARQIMKKNYTTYVELKRTTIFVQRKFRANLDMKRQKEMYEKIRFHIISIQCSYRAKLLMRQQSKEYLEVRNKIVKIQQKWKATLLARKLRAKYLAVQYYTLIIQQKFRANKIMKVEREKYLKLQSSVIKIQRRFRAKLQMRSEHNFFVRKVQAIKTIQIHFKAYKQMRYQRAKYQGTKEAVKCIQSYFKGFLKMRQDREKFLKQIRAVRVIQTAFRTYRKMKLQKEEFQRTKQAVIFIQMHWRAIFVMRAQRKQYLRMRNVIIFIQNRVRAKLLGDKVRKQYILQRALIISLQKKFRAKQLMLKELKNYQLLRHSAICIQNYYRSHLLTKQQMINYQLKRSSVVKIQKWFRSVRQMRHEQQSYQRLRSAAIKIQQKLRATLKAREQRTKFVRTKENIIYVQRLVRGTLAMKEQRKQYHKLKEVCIFIQRRYRARREMLQIRSQYQLLRSLIICLQRRYRGKQLMLKLRKDFILLKTIVVHLQQKFRGHKIMQTERENFLQLKTNIVKFQAQARGLLARRRLQALMTPEMLDILKQKKAAKVIQRFWRGYRIRKRLNNIRIKVIRKNIALLKETSKSVNSIKFKVNDAVRLLRGRFSASEALNVLMRLDRISRTVPHLLMCRSDFISTFCYGIMAQAIRSEVDKQLILYCSRIILNLARYNSTTANTFQEGGLVTIAQMLLRWCDKDCEIFNTLCTLIWVFAHCPVKRKVICDFMTTTEAIYMVRETKKLVVRKEKMKQNVRKPAPTVTTFLSTVSTPSVRGYQQHQQNFSSRSLPSLQPDYGVIRNKPYTFISSVYAFDALLCKLGINIF